MMKRIPLMIAAAVAATLLTGASQASAKQPFGYPFFPFGFYQPYGATYGTALPTPPYFATNPPVYYGARHARPYGVSPFASPPVVRAGQGYRSRLRSDFYLPPSELETPAPSCNPYVSTRAESPAPKLGQIRSNPFVAEAEAKIARK
jgi:hypothetical protein